MIRYLVLALAMIAFGDGGSARAGQPINIGMTMSLTGYLALFDTGAVDGAKLAAQAINAKGGIDGHPIALHVLDNTSNAATGVTVVNDLINRYDVDAIASGALSAQTVAIEPIVARNRVPVLTMSVIPSGMQWTFSMAEPPAQMLNLELDFAAHHLNAKRIAFLYSQTPYGQLGAKLIDALAHQSGLEVAFDEGVAVAATDLTPQIARLKATQPDAIVDFLTGPVHLVEAKAATTVGLTIPTIMATDDLSTLQQAAGIYHKSYFVASPIQTYPDVPDPEVRTAVKAFLDAFKASGLDKREISQAGEGWDLLHIVAHAFSPPTVMQSAKLRDAFLHLDYIGAYGRFQFQADDHTGQMHHPTTSQIAQFQDNQVKVVGRNQP